MRFAKFGCGGFLCGAAVGGIGLFLTLTGGKMSYFHEVGEQSPLSLMVIGAIPGAVLGFLVGLALFFFQAPPKE